MCLIDKMLLTELSVQIQTRRRLFEKTIQEREYDMGGWTATAALFSLEVEHSTNSKLLGKTLYTPSVSGIVDVLHVDIGADEEAKNFKVAAVREA
ncbi:hypothetical protein PInf_029594 [Phytophthora infestans]|nr:hypothetical protein PInf_029594 [Phytophthora infestans]